MLYLQQFQNNRVDDLKQYQRLHSSLDRNFSLCSNQYSEKFPRFPRIEPSNIDYSRDRTLFFLSKKSSTEMKTTNENQQQTGITQKNKNSTTNLTKTPVHNDDKQISNENNPTRWYHQVSRNVNGVTKTKSKGKKAFSTSFQLPMQSSTESDRPITVPLSLDEDIQRTRIKSNIPSRPLNPHVIDFADNFDDLTSSSIFQFKSPITENDNQYVHRSYTDTSLDSPVVNKPSTEVREETPNELNIPHRSNLLKMNGFQHIANLGNWRHHSKARSTKTPEIDHDDVSNYSTNRIYEYKSPFSEEYDQAILLQAQTQTVYNNNEWNLQSFYRDVKTPFEAGTNTKPVFEKCLKLSKLQATTIKWEQRRRQNMNIYNRLIKNSPYDGNFLNLTGNFSTNLADLKRELRCNECKRVTCLGNCAPGQEYNQYKRLIPLSPLPNTREQIRYKLSLRTQRSMIDVRPRSQQMIRAEPTNLNPVVVVPLFEDESSTKPSQRKLGHGFPPGRSLRSHRRETLTFYSSHKVSL